MSWFNNNDKEKELLERDLEYYKNKNSSDNEKNDYDSIIESIKYKLSEYK